MAASTNSKMSFLNVSIKGLNGQPHPALSGISTTQSVRKSRAHMKMLADDLYTYEKSQSTRVGPLSAFFCNSECTEDLVHILTTCKTYEDTRSRILFQM